MPSSINSKKTIMSENTLDLRGEACPFPFLHSKEKLDSLKKGEILSIFVSDDSALESIGLLIQHLKLASTVYNRNGFYEIIVKRG